MKILLLIIILESLIYLTFCEYCFKPKQCYGKIRLLYNDWLGSSINAQIAAIILEEVLFFCYFINK